MSIPRPVQKFARRTGLEKKIDKDKFKVHVN